MTVGWRRRSRPAIFVIISPQAPPSQRKLCAGALREVYSVAQFGAKTEIPEYRKGPSMQRRDLLKSFASTAAGLTILRSGTLRGASAPSNKLNIALIGAWGRGTAHYESLRNENVVALCDVNDLRTKEALRLFPGAKTYHDWRRCLEQKDIEAVVICTADHHHAFIANWALNRNMHVFCEKPLGISVEEVRVVRANYLKRKAKVATQHGTQRHAYPNLSACAS